jgi:hypothetical protein
MIAADFANADEKSWQARYDYNFAAIGLPGLTLMTRYVTGDNFGANGNRQGMGARHRYRLRGSRKAA